MQKSILYAKIALISKNIFFPNSVLNIIQGWGQVQLTKYSSTPSTPNIYHYKYWSSTHFLKKYLSTSSTFISSTSTSTHNKISYKVRMDIQSRVNFRWTK